MNKPTDRQQQADMEALLGIGRPGAGIGRRLWRIGLWSTLVIAAAIGLYALLGGGTSAPPAYVTEPATLADLTIIVTATGTVEPTNQVDVSSELSGIVRRVLVDYNSAVVAGDVLAELDTDKLTATVDSSRARLVAVRAAVLETRATVTETKLALDRKRMLAATRAASQQDLDAARAAHDRAVASQAVAEADVGVALAQLQLDETNLSKAAILSPINGIVLERNVDPGQTVATSFQAPVLFTIAEDLREIEVRVDVDEADVGKVREGQRASFSVDAHPERRFEAAIRQLRFGSEVVQGVVTYKAVLATENAELLLRPGMTATAEIVVERLAGVLTVPNAALRFSPPPTAAPASGQGLLSKLLPRMPSFRPASRPEDNGGPRQVWVLRDGHPVAVPVTVGATDGRRTAILGGSLEAGWSVIVDIAAGKR